MNKKTKHFLIASFFAILMLIATFVFKIEQNNIDEFFDRFAKYLNYMWILLIAILSIHVIFPTKKKCKDCSHRLKGLLSPILILFYNSIPNGKVKQFKNAFYLCKNCSNVYSYKMKKLGNLDHSKK